MTECDKKGHILGPKEERGGWMWSVCTRCGMELALYEIESNSQKGE